MRCLCWYVCWLLMICPLYAQVPVDLSNGYSVSLEARHILFLKAPQSVGLTQILRSEYQSQFAPSPRDVPNFGYNNQTAYWFKIKLFNPNLRIQDWRLNLGHPLLDSLHLYVRDSAGLWQVTKTGYRMPWHTKSLPHTAFAFPLSWRGEIEVYIRAWGNNPVLMPLSIQRRDDYEEANRWADVGYGFFFGALFVMLLYNLFVFYVVRDITYLYYVLTILCTLTIIAAISGYGFKFVWPQAHEVNFFITRTAMGLLVITTGLFSIRFLDTKRYVPWLHWLLLGSMGFGGIVLVTMFFPGIYFTSWYPRLPNSATTIQTLLLMTAGIAAWAKGNKVARFYVLAWCFYLTGGLLLMLRNSSLLPFHFWTSHGVEIGSLLEVVLLSLALGDRYRLLRQEREAAVSQNLRLQQEANEALEAKVTVRTQQLMEVNEELHQIVEELNSANDTLNELNVELGLQKRELEKKNESITASIHYARRIQQAILPSEQRMAETFGADGFFALYQPRDLVSGDFYWMVQVEGDVLLAVVDCTGHGVPGAFMSIIGYELLSHLVADLHIRQPSDILDQLHDGLLKVLRQKGQVDIQDGMDMALVRISTTETMADLTFAGAMNTALLIGPDQVIELKGNKRPIGGRDVWQNRPFQSHQASVPRGTMLYLFTDGYKDQFGGTPGQSRKFMSRRFKQLLQHLHAMPLPIQKQQLHEHLLTWMQTAGERQTDDITVVGIRL